MKYAHSGKGIEATAIYLLWQNYEFSYTEALKALQIECGMTTLEAIQFLRDGKDGD